MTDPLLPLGDGHTPLSEDDRAGLKPTWVSTRGDLNAAEQENLLAGRVKWLRVRAEVDRLLDDTTLRRLHGDMFGDVWTWAGTYRQRDMSIGVDWTRIGPELRNLTGDARYWLPDGGDTDILRFHRRLVAIHPFPNGNGRHARLACDLLALACDLRTYTWGSRRDDPAGQVRADYLAALRRVDRDPDDLDDLIAFARS